MKSPARSVVALIILSCGLNAQANPTGGNVTAGSATISGTGTSAVTVNQGSKVAIINWNSFSIGQGEQTTFLQPGKSSAVLNRVTGSGLSSINGLLSGNGQIFLINGNGIIIGAGGVVNAAGFTASTRDITDSQFLSGKYQFTATGNNAAGVQNFGEINALGGDIYLIGRTVDNQGTLSAPAGTVGLAVGDSVLIKQSGDEHVFVKSGTSSAVASTGINNSGSITATAAELRAAGGNMYALAINNGGTIRATTTKSQGGRIFLTSDKGIVANTGTLDASATADQGTGGNIVLKAAGTIVDHGKIIARGGQGGHGGTVDLSGDNLDFTGGVDLTASGGTTGDLLLDPTSITVIDDPNANGTLTQTGTTTTYTPAPNFTNGSTLYTAVLQAQLEAVNVIVNGVNNVTIASPVSWNAPTSLTLQTTVKKGGTIVINAPITGIFDQTNYDNFLIANPNVTGLTGKQASLILDAAGNGFITTGANGGITVDNFTLKNGFWQQIVSSTPANSKNPGFMAGPLPTFIVQNDFQLLNTSTFERFAGGDGKSVNAKNPADSPYEVVDIFGLQGIGSPSGLLLSGSFILDNDINLTAGAVTYSTAYWNGGDISAGDDGAGWVPIGEGGSKVTPFSGTFDGNNHTVAGFYLYRPESNLHALFGEVSGTIKNLSVDVATNFGSAIGGEIVGRLDSKGLILNCVSGRFYTEPLPSIQDGGTTENQSNLPDKSVGVSAAAGGIAGEVMKGASVVDCFSGLGFVLIDGGGGPGTAGVVGMAGLVGVNYGTITNSFTTGYGQTDINVEGVPGLTQKFQDNSIALGGLVGANYGVINGGGSYDAVVQSISSGSGGGSIVSGTGNIYLGGFVGVNYGTVNGTVKVNGQTLQYQSFTTNDVVAPDGADVAGGTGSYYVGGFVGGNYGTISNAYSAATYQDSVGGFTTGGGYVIANGDLVGPSGGATGALGDYAIGGFVGGNFGSITNSGTADTVIAHGGIEGVGDVTTKKNGATTTSPLVINFSNPLSLNSIMVGGFVGLNGAKSSITNSFADAAGKTINFSLDQTSPQTPLPSPGQTFNIFSNSDDPLVSSDGLITGGSGFYIVGGFAGANYGTLATSYTTSNVTATGTTTQSNSYYTGGLVGINSGTISNTYALGNVSSYTTSSGNQTGLVGGLVAEMFTGNITNSYSVGSVVGGITRGGLVGVAAGGKVTGSFWNLDGNGSLNGYSAGGTGETLAAMMTSTGTLSSSIYNAAKWNFTTIWTVGGTPQLPTLRNVP